MKFNMGCGHNRIEGFVNVDAQAACKPDKVVDLEKTPWPFKTGCAEEVRFIHSLEHMGERPRVFLAIMKELYRMAAPGCRVTIHVPHPRHDNYLNDPTHVRPITGPMLQLFNRALNDEWQAGRVANSPLAHYTGVDFRIVEYEEVLAEPYRAERAAGRLDDAALAAHARDRNNVIEELRVVLEAVK